MDNNLLFPPLRLVLNTTCNGKCFFCHHEGATSGINEMSLSLVSECIEAAEHLNIGKISLTGGEPTLRNDLDEIVDMIKQKLPTVNLGITTNGFGLHRISQKTLGQLDQINLSLTSFCDTIIDKYQRVDPSITFKLLQPYAKKTTINIVVVGENKNSLISIIEHCFDFGFNVDLMFDLVSNDIQLQTEVLSSLTKKYGLFSIHYYSTPVMMQYNNARLQLRIKSPSISSIFCRSICKQCPHRIHCSERICALRVYPNGRVSPCLNNYVISSQKTVYDQILDIYPKLGVDLTDLYSIVLRQHDTTTAHESLTVQ